jgi:hypothetical protein
VVGSSARMRSMVRTPILDIARFVVA